MVYGDGTFRKKTSTDKHCSRPEEYISAEGTWTIIVMKYYRGQNDCGGYFSKLGYFIILEFKN